MKHQNSALSRNIIVALALCIPLLTCSLPTRAQSSAGGNVIFGVQELPATNMLNTRVDALPVHPQSATWISSLHKPNNPIYCVFDSQPYAGQIVGIPYNAIPASQGSMVNITFTLYGDESDPGPYLIAPNPKVEGSSSSGKPDVNGEEGTSAGSGDGHEITLDTTHGISYELFQFNGTNSASSGAIFNLSSNAERTPGYTAACALGYTLLVPLAKYAEVQSGSINHAIGITFDKINNAGYSWPGNHAAGSANSSSWPSMGQYGRLKASSLTALLAKSPPPQAKIILQALATYGFILQEGGSDGYINGDANTGWSHSDLSWIKSNTVISRDLEFVDVSSLEISPSSAQAGASSGTTGSTGSTGGTHKHSKPRAK